MDMSTEQLLKEKNDLKKYVQGIKIKTFENMDKLLQKIETIRNEIKKINLEKIDIGSFSNQVKTLIKCVNDLPQESQQVLDFLNIVDANNVTLKELDKKYVSYFPITLLDRNNSGIKASHKSASVNNRKSQLFKKSGGKSRKTRKYPRKG